MKVIFVLASTAHGTMIVPRTDFQESADKSGWGFGVGGSILEQGHHELELDLPIMAAAVGMARRDRGPGVVVIDGGANIGTVTLTLAHQMQDWGAVLAFEPQDRIFMALCGNVAINNLFNVQAFRAALGRKDGMIDFPVPDYSKFSNFGGVSAVGANDIGQDIERWAKMPLKAIDTLGLDRLDLLKLDLEGMEMEALEGAKETIRRCQPVMCVEHIKVGIPALQSYFAGIGYESEAAGLNLFGAPPGHDIIKGLRDAWERKKATAA